MTARSSRWATNLGWDANRPVSWRTQCGSASNSSAVQYEERSGVAERTCATVSTVTASVGPPKLRRTNVTKSAIRASLRIGPTPGISRLYVIPPPVSIGPRTPCKRIRIRRDGGPTTHGEPTYIIDGVVHYCVTNMPGAVGRTSTYALCNVTLPWMLRIANAGGIVEAADCVPSD